MKKKHKIKSNPTSSLLKTTIATFLAGSSLAVAQQVAQMPIPGSSNSEEVMPESMTMQGSGVAYKGGGGNGGAGGSGAMGVSGGNGAMGGIGGNGGAGGTGVTGVTGVTGAMGVKPGGAGKSGAGDNLGRGQ